MKIIVPKSVDVKRLVAGLNLSPTRSVHLENKIYYFLSRIVSTNDNYKLNEKNDGYRNICSTDMKKVLGNRDYYLILKILTRIEGPIVETNKSWHNPLSDNKCGFCKEYRLTAPYNTGEVIFKTLPDKFQKRLFKSSKGEQAIALLNNRFRFLKDQFETNPLSFDPQVFEFINAVGTKLLNRVGKDNPYQINLILNLIGRWLYYIEKIEANEIWISVSADNHRLHSNLTNLPEILRPFLLGSGKPLIMVDVSSTQPYILSSVMNMKFFYGNGYGYNLRTIYPELYDELVGKGYISKINASGIISGAGENSTYTGSTIYQSNSTVSSTGQSNNSHLTANTSPFMWCQFFTYPELVNIEQYQQSPFNLDFYTHILKSYHQNTNYTGYIDYFKERKRLKNSMMYVMFDNNQDHRNHNPYIQIFKSVYPGTDKWINEAHKVIGKEKFAYLLQRTESYLLLNNVSREFHEKYPMAPIFTIHDAVCTDEEYIPGLTRLILERLYDITGVRVGFKIKTQPATPELQTDVVDDLWAEIRNVNTKKKYEKVSSGVFSSNIERGLNFLKKTEHFKSQNRENSNF